MSGAATEQARIAEMISANTSSGMASESAARSNARLFSAALTAIKQALAAHFEPVLEAHRPYFARLLGRLDLEASEHALLDAQLLPALGLWYIAQRAG